MLLIWVRLLSEVILCEARRLRGVAVRWAFGVLVKLVARRVLDLFDQVFLLLVEYVDFLLLLGD